MAETEMKEAAVPVLTLDPFGAVPVPETSQASAEPAAAATKRFLPRVSMASLWLSVHAMFPASFPHRFHGLHQFGIPMLLQFPVRKALF